VTRVLAMLRRETLLRLAERQVTVPEALTGTLSYTVSACLLAQPTRRRTYKRLQLRPDAPSAQLSRKLT
jgi:hypothetical protein